MKILYFLKGIIKSIGVAMGLIIFCIPYVPYGIYIVLVEIGSNNAMITGDGLHRWEKFWNQVSEKWLSW